METRHITDNERLDMPSCPFCGKKDLLDFERSERTRGWIAVVCRHCGCVGASKSTLDPIVALDIWRVQHKTKNENRIGGLLNQLQRIRKQASRIDGCSANHDISHEIDSICTELEEEIEKGIVNFYGIA